MRQLTHPAPALLGVALLASWGCSSSQASRPNGPVYGSEGGADVATDNPPDSSFPVDAPMVHDAPAHTDVTTHVDGGKEGGSKDAPTAHHEAGGDATTDSPEPGEGGESGINQFDASACPSGSGTIALLGGTSQVAFGAVSTNGGAFKLTTFGAGTVASPPALVPFAGGSFLGVFSTTTTNYILSTLYTPAGGTSAWSTPSNVPAVAGSDAGATELGSPGLAVLGGGGADLVYQGTSAYPSGSSPVTHAFYHGVYASDVWGAASDPVLTGGSQDYGPSSPSVAVVGSTLYAAYDGGNGGLYVNSWTAGAGWGGASPIVGAGVTSIPPTLVAMNGGTADVMLVYEDNAGQNVIHSVVHTSAGWQAPIVVSTNATTTSPVSLAPLSSGGGGVVLVYQGENNGYPYSSIYDPTASTPWTTPVEIYPNSLALQSAPTVATGTCGVDAIATLVETVGVEVVTLKNGVWAPPYLVSTLSQMTFATIATSSP